MRLFSRLKNHHRYLRCDGSVGSEIIIALRNYHHAGIEIDGRNWDRSWVTGIRIEVWLQESGSKLAYRNWDRSWVTGIEIEVGLQESELMLASGIEIEVGDRN